MLEFDKEKVTHMIMEEIGCGRVLSESMTEQLGKVHPDLYPIVSAWLDGRKEAFEFLGVTSDEIMEKTHGVFIDAIFSMSTMLKHPDMVPRFKRRKYIYR